MGTERSELAHESVVSRWPWRLDAKVNSSHTQRVEENELDGPLDLLERRLRMAPGYLVDPDACLAFRYGTPVGSGQFSVLSSSDR